MSDNPGFCKGASQPRGGADCERSKATASLACAPPPAPRGRSRRGVLHSFAVYTDIRPSILARSDRRRRLDRLTLIEGGGRLSAKLLAARSSLHRRARHVGVGAIDTAIAGLGLEPCAAALAVVEELAGINRHLLLLAMTALRACERRGPLDLASGLSHQRVPRALRCSFPQTRSQPGASRSRPPAGSPRLRSRSLVPPPGGLAFRVRDASGEFVFKPVQRREHDANQMRLLAHQHSRQRHDLTAAVRSGTRRSTSRSTASPTDRWPGGHSPNPGRIQLLDIEIIH